MIAPRALALLAAAAGLAVSAPAQGQAWIGLVVGNMMANAQAAQRRHECRMGVPLPASEVEETRAPAAAAVAAYWAAVSDGGPRDIARLFEGDRDARWIDGATVVRAKAKRGALVSDRFAVSGAAISSAPVWFLRSGDGVHVRGLWLVRDAAGTPTGAYDMTLRRNLGRWHLRTIALYDAASAPLAMAQYCEREGDVASYRTAYLAAEKLREEKRAAKARKKAEQAARKAGRLCG